MQTTFADTILNVAVTGSLVRFEYGTVVPVQTEAGKQELRATPTLQIVMPIDGFARAFSIQDQLIKKLVEDGVLNTATPNNSTAAA